MQTLKDPNKKLKKHWVSLLLFIISAQRVSKSRLSTPKLHRSSISLEKAFFHEKYLPIAALFDRRHKLIRLKLEYRNYFPDNINKTYYIMNLYFRLIFI